MTRVRAFAYAALAALGCALAAAASSTGPFLEADRKVAPFEGFRRRRVLRPERPEDEGGITSRIQTVFDAVFQVIVIALATGLVAWGLFLFVRALVRLYRLRVVRSRPVPTDEYDPGEETREDAETKLRKRVAEELRLLTADLDNDVEAREAVIACYVRMEAALASAGTPRAATETPLELLRRVLGAYDVPAADVRRLTELFTEARFSDHPVTDEMRASARRSLAAVSDSLAVRA